MAKKKHRRCDDCGERDLYLTCFTVMVDGRRQARWRLCRCCAAVRYVRLATGR